MPNTTKQAVVVPQAALDANRGYENLALFDRNGSPFTGSDTTFEPVTTATVIGTAAKVVSTPEPPANTLVPIKFTAGNTAASPTVAFAGGAARAIQLGGVAPTAAEITLAANGVAVFWFDGTILHQLGVYA